MVNTGRIFWLTAACLLVMAGCHPKRQYYPRTMPERTVEIIRFDSALLSIRADHAADDVQAVDAEGSELPHGAEDLGIALGKGRPELKAALDAVIREREARR